MDIRKGDEVGDAQIADWVKQAAKLPRFLAPRSGPRHMSGCGHFSARAREPICDEAMMDCRCGGRTA
jgi:hypothetical protein